MSFQVQNIVNQTRPIEGLSLATAENSSPVTAQQPSILSVQNDSSPNLIERLGQEILDEVKGLFTGGTPQLSEEQLTVRDELTELALTKAKTPEEAIRYKAAIEELFETFKGETKPSDSSLDRLLETGKKIGITKDTASKAFSVIRNWDSLSSSDRVFSAGTIGVEVLENLGVFSKEEASDYKGVASAVSILSNSQVSSRDKAFAAAQALAGLTTTSFTGEIGKPETIGGVKVIKPMNTEDGSAGYLLADGSVAPQSDLTTTVNVASAIQALGVLTGEGETKDKILALTGIGVNAAQANELIDDVDAGRIGAAFSVFNTVNNWDEMNNGQRFSATLQTADTVITALGSKAGAQAGASTFATVGSQLLSGVASVAGIVMGADQAVDVVKSIRNMPRSEAMKAGALGLGMSGAAIGAGIATASAVASGAALGATIGSSVPVVGTLIGGAIGAVAGLAMGAFGSGKNKSQRMRDSWRSSMEQNGFSKKVDGSHHVQLADGSSYNIGKDGGHKLINADGTKRHTFDIDWGSSLLEGSIPDAHLFAIATGLDPVSHNSRNLFHEAVAQGWNAATSNATSPEGVRANFRTMIESGGVAPEELALKFEVLRVSNKITEEQYQVYLGHLNKMFETSFQPTERATTHKALVQQLASAPELGEQEQALLMTLIDENEYAKSLEELNEVLERDKENLSKPMPVYT